MPDPVPNRLSGAATPNVAARRPAPPPASAAPPAAPGQLEYPPVQAAPVVLGEGAGEPVYWGPLPDREPARPRRGGVAGLLMSPFGIRLLIFAVVMLGAFMARDFVIGPVENMKVGDCIDVPAEDAEFGTIQHHPCDQPHGGEIIEIFNVSGLPALLYPSSADPWSAISPVCASAFDAYTGTRFADRPEFDITYFTPTPKTWANGDRSVTCVVIRDDDAALTASLRRP